jgi:general secretion pathway protein N
MAVTAQRLPTVLLAAFAGWCLMVAIVVYAGLGARYSLHPDDASLVPELPRLDLARAQAPLDELAQYAQVGERPLFNADRRPLPPPENPDAVGQPPVAAAPLDVTLTSVIISGDTRIAILLDKKDNKSQSVKLGNALAGEQSAYKLVELGPRKAVFEGPEGRKEVELRVFDGTGGEAPTPVASATEVQGAAAAPAEATAGVVNANADPNAQTPESRAELIRRRIEERRRQMREEAERAAKQNNGQ